MMDLSTSSTNNTDESLIVNDIVGGINPIYDTTITNSDLICIYEEQQTLINLRRNNCYG